jgi:hypothetical protein
MRITGEPAKILKRGTDEGAKFAAARYRIPDRLLIALSAQIRLAR